MPPIYHLGPRVRKLHQLIVQTVDRKITALDLTGTQSFILRYISTREGETVYPKDIEKRFNLTHPTVSGILQRLESKDFVQLVPDPDDRRCKQVVLTEKSKRCQEEICAHICSLEQTALRGMTEDEIQMFLRFLDLAEANLNQFTPEEESKT